MKRLEILANFYSQKRIQLPQEDRDTLALHLLKKVSKDKKFCGSRTLGLDLLDLMHTILNPNAKRCRTEKRSSLYRFLKQDQVLLHQITPFMSIGIDTCICGHFYWSHNYDNSACNECNCKKLELKEG